MLLPGMSTEADLAAALEQVGEQVEHLGDFVGLQQHGVVVDRVAHRHRDLHLPVPCPVLDDGIEDFAQMRFRQRIDLRVHAGPDPGRVGEAQRAQRMIEAALDAALPIVNVARSVDRHSERADAGLDRGADALLGERARAGLDPAMDAGVGDRLGDGQPVLAQVSFAADQGDLARAEFGELAHDVEAFLGRELALALASGARAAVNATQIAGERELPHHLHRAVRRHVLVGREPARQAARARDVRFGDRDGARPLTRASPCRRPASRAARSRDQVASARS